MQRLKDVAKKALLGFLGQYVKNIQERDLKIAIWEGEVFMENMELVLEAFDYLQLPFSLKEGRVGKLSITIPWTKVGFEPIIITLEDVFIRASKRDDLEWSVDAVERREFAGKKAKLVAAELGKFSRRVCDNQAGQSFMSYITAKVLDKIHLSIRNFHVLYSDMQTDSVNVMLGIRLSSLTIMKQNPVGLSSTRGAQVNKVVEVTGLEIYCSTSQGAVDLVSMEHVWNSKFCGDARVECNKHDHILAPCDVSVSVWVNRSGKLDDDSPQYSISAELTGLVMSLNEVQLQRILILWDYLSTYEMREKYGRYRPWHCPLSKKSSGWPKLWWHYAQESVLSDVRKKLKKTSWRYFGQRLSYRRKYVNLYRTKLQSLREEQLVDKSILHELEQMEKESDIDDILNFRSVAECELQEFLLDSSVNNIGANDVNAVVDTSHNEENSSRKSRGWLNWLSRGMLGAGGTDDSSQFSGVVSDEVIKDLYEETSFHPLVSSNGDAAENEKICICALKFSIHEISATLRSMSASQDTAEVIVNGIVVDCKLWDEFASSTVLINSVEMICPRNKKAILHIRRSPIQNIVLENEQPSCSVQVDTSPSQEVQLSIKVMLQPLEVTCYADFFLDLFEIFDVLKSSSFQRERVLASLNGIEDVKTRLLAKADYILSSHKKVIWDVRIVNVFINIPWTNSVSEQCSMVLESNGLCVKSENNLSSSTSSTEDQPYILKQLSNLISSCDHLTSFQIRDLYDLFEVMFNGFEIKILMPSCPEAITILERFDASISLASCAIPNESILKQLEVYLAVSSLAANLSPIICESIVVLIANLHILHSRSASLMTRNLNSTHITSYKLGAPIFYFSLTANLEFISFYINLANAGDDSSTIMLSLPKLDIRYGLEEFEECWVSVKALKITTYPFKSEGDIHTLCSSGKLCDTSSVYQQDMVVGHTNSINNCNDKSSSAEACFLLHHEASRRADLVWKRCKIWLNNLDLHCHPYIMGLLIEFYDRISSYGAHHSDNSFNCTEDVKPPKAVPDFPSQKFVHSNFFKTMSSEYENISLDCFPFVTINNSNALDNVEGSILYPSTEWRKYFHVRDIKSRSPRNIMNNGYTSSAMESSGFPMQLNYGAAKRFPVDMNFTDVRVHFHDSTCIVGTITLPTSKSSLSVSEDSMDIMGSIDGLILSSSWSPQEPNDFVWGPSLSDQSPIINIRVRNENASSLKLNSKLEVSIGIQHVCCTLSPEYLAIIIGYFCLPDWSSSSSQQSVTENCQHVNTEQGSSIIYKFEILDSVLLLPIESKVQQRLKLEIQQLYCSYIHDGASDIVFDGIPSEYVISSPDVAGRYNCLNIFGRELFLSLLSLKDDVYGCSGHSTDCGTISLIAPLSADIWIRLPCEDASYYGSCPASTCIMTRIINCQLLADDGHFLDGLKALIDVIDHFSIVGNEASCFTSDVLQFLQTKTDSKRISAALPIPSEVVFTEMRCSVDSLSIELHSLKDESALPLAKVITQFSFLASFRDIEPLRLDLSFSSLALHSLLNRVSLAQCAVTCSTSTVLGISLLKSDGDVDEVEISLPSLHIWLHFLDWVHVIGLVNSFSGKLAKTAPTNESQKNCSATDIDPIEDTMQTSSQSLLQISSISTDVAQEKIKDNIILIVRSEDIGITLHLPIQVNEEAFNSQSIPWNIKEGKCCKYVAITMHSRRSALYINEKNARFKLTSEKISSEVEICKENIVNSLPFFQILQVNVEADISSSLKELLHANIEAQCDRFEVWLTHHIFYFWNNVGLDTPEEGSSHPVVSSLDFKFKLRKVSLLLTDGRWSCGGPLLEILMRDFLLCANVNENSMDVSLDSDLQVNYNNIDKVVWEPFVEPWKFHLKIIRKFEIIGLLNSSIATDIHLTSAAQLNLNLTESLIECAFRTAKMVMDAWGLITPNDIPEKSFVSPQFSEDVCAGRYAPYILQNSTSLPLVYHVYQGQINSDELDIKEMDDGKSVDPGSSVPIYLNETQEEQLSRCRPVHYSDRLNENQLNGAAHHFMTIQLDGTSMPSAPISMDLVGLTSFEVDFSKVSNKVEIEKTGDATKYNANNEENVRTNDHSGFVLPVVFDVSVQRNSKFIRLYSTVLLFNATSVPLEIRFDIPFGLSPMILDPVYPGQEFPLPLHLAEAGRMRWRPLGDSYLWSEAHNLSNILSQETKIGFLRSFVCYPSHPSSNPFRCCISVQNICLPSSSREKKVSSPHFNHTLNPQVDSCGEMLHGQGKSKKRFIHQVTLSTPLVVNNYLPEAVSLTIDCGGVTYTSLLSEVQTSFHHIDPLHDLGLEFHMHGFKPSALKFPRTETFSTVAKCSGSKFSISETMTFNPALQNGPVYVTMEKMMDAYSGAREVFIFVPFLLFNCTGFPLIINSANDTKETGCTLPSCYDLTEHELLCDEKNGLSILSSDNVSFARAPQTVSPENLLSKSRIVSTRKNIYPQSSRFPNRSLMSSSSSNIYPGQLDMHNLESQKDSSRNLRDPDLVDNDRQRAKACMYSPNPVSSSSEATVKVCMCPSDCGTGSVPNSAWSNPFSLLPPSGSSNVLVPQSSSNAAFIISVTSSALGGPFAGRTEAITFQPRYVIINACSKDLCYKQKGTEFVFNLGIGQHSHLHWTDTTRELLVSIRFHEPGWQWSGSFFPDHLGDTQVKIRNYVSGALNMVRVEVQNADISMGDEKIVGNLHGNSGTNLILLSDDDTGYMPYRIDNFSKERLRIYQQRCETFDTIVHPYTSCPYAWDEPCYPHRLSIEVPGERVLGSYTLDEVKEYVPACVPPTSEKPERILLLSVHAEGATKVLSIIDSSYHILKDTKHSSAPRMNEKGKREQKQDKHVDYKEKFSLTIPYVGVSVINSYPQELLFVCARNITIDLLQSLDQQKLSFQVLSLQIDNQLRIAPFPVVLSFDRECRINPTNQIKTKDNAGRTIAQTTSNSSVEPVFYAAVAMWRNKDSSLVSFEYICLRVADCHLELEQGLILSLFDFIKSVSSRFQSRVLPVLDSMVNDSGLIESSSRAQAHEYVKDGDQQLNINVAFSKNSRHSSLLLSVVPIGAPWQQIYLLARRQKKIYVELFDIAPINLTLSFSSAPWMLRNRVLASGESVIHRGLMALADVEGARIYLKQLTIAHQMASWESIQEILIRHYTRQLLHETYKVFGSAGVIGNPMGFARSLGLGIRDFLSAPARSILQSPTGLITGMAEGTTSLVSNTVYALSDAATQFTKAAHKGIVAFTFDDQTVARMENQHSGVASHSKGLVNEVLEGLTGLLQSPIKGAEKHGLPGVLSGIALGITGVVARPAASILEATGKTAQSIRNRSRLYQTGARRYRIRLPRPLSRELPLRPYSWEEAVGASVLVEAHDGVKFKDEILVMCKALKQAGKYAIITERLILIVSCSSLVNLGKPEFRGVAVDPEWVIESEIGLESVIHTDSDEGVVHIVGSSSDAISRQNQHHSKKGGKRWNNIPTPLPLFQTNLELNSREDAELLLQVLLSTIEHRKQRGRGSAHLLHRSNIK